jgi:hypothetical protein
MTARRDGRRKPVGCDERTQWVESRRVCADNMERLGTQSDGYAEDMMPQSNTTSAWAKPMLIVLTRGRPEEVVLTVCKGAGGSGPSVEDGVCVGPKKVGMCNKCKQGGRS